MPGRATLDHDRRFCFRSDRPCGKVGHPQQKGGPNSRSLTAVRGVRDQVRDDGGKSEGEEGFLAALGMTGSEESRQDAGATRRHGSRKTRRNERRYRGWGRGAAE